MTKFTLSDKALARLQEEERKHRAQIASWIRAELEIKDKTQLDLASFLGIQASQMTRLMQGKRGLDIWELRQIEEFLGAKALNRVEVMGTVGDGVWRDQAPIYPSVSSFDVGIVSNDAAQRAYKVDSPSTDGSFRPEDIVYAVDSPNILEKGGLKSGLLVLTRRERGGDLFQYTISRLMPGSKRHPTLEHLFEHTSAADREIVTGPIVGLTRRIAHPYELLF